MLDGQAIVLDDAMQELSEPDREAVLLRYFERRPFALAGGSCSSCSLASVTMIRSVSAAPSLRLSPLGAVGDIARRDRNR